MIPGSYLHLYLVCYAQTGLWIYNCFTRADDSEDHGSQAFDIGLYSACDWEFVFLRVEVENEVFYLNGNSRSDHYCDTEFCHTID